MCRQGLLLILGFVVASIVAGFERNVSAAETGKQKVEMLPSEAGGAAAKGKAPTAAPSNGDGITLNGFNPATIVELRDGSLITESGMQSTDRGRTWKKSPTFKPAGNKGLLRLPNGELGAFQGSWGMKEALGNATNHWYFRWSADEGRSWSEPVQITLPGLTMGLAGTMLALRDGKRIMVVTYSQFLGSRFDKRGASWGSYKGVRLQPATAGPFPLNEVCRVYYSDDNGRTWKPCDGWIMGWRDRRWSDAITEADGVELKDGRIMVIGRTLNGRLYQAFSPDRGHSWWPGAQPMELAASYSPGRICRLPKTGDLLVVWNQLSRAEIRKGFRRSRLSCTVSKDEGKTWVHLKNIEAIESLASLTRVPPDSDFTPVWGDDEVGELPEDFALFHYPRISVVGNEVYISYLVTTYGIQNDKDGKPAVRPRSSSRTRILPVEWFYR